MVMSDSILISVKRLIGLAEDYEVFDEQILVYINTAFATLTQLGVGPITGFIVTSSDDCWTDFIPEGPMLGLVKTYVGKKVQFLFDPPTSGALSQALERALAEYEWRCYMAAEANGGG